MKKEKCVCGANKPGDDKTCGCLQSREKFPDSVPKWEGLTRKHYGTNKDNPPNLHSPAFYWEGNEHAWNYGWNESNAAFLQRQRDLTGEKKGKKGKKSGKDK